MEVRLVSESLIGLFYEKPWRLVICQRCHRRGAWLPQGLYDGEWCEDRVVHAVQRQQDGTWQEIDFHPTPLADERLLMQLLLTNNW